MTRNSLLRQMLYPWGQCELGLPRRCAKDNLGRSRRYAKKKLGFVKFTQRCLEPPANG